MTRTFACSGASCFSAARSRAKLFGNVQPVGETVRIRGMAFEVIGVQREKVQLSNYGRPDKESVFIPHTTAGQLWNTEYLNVLVYQAVDPTLDARVSQRRSGRRSASACGSIRPTIEPCGRFGSAESQEITAGIVLGLKLVLTFIGVLTLAIGAVGRDEHHVRVDPRADPGDRPAQGAWRAAAQRFSGSSCSKGSRRRSSAARLGVASPSSSCGCSVRARFSPNCWTTQRGRPTFTCS